MTMSNGTPQSSQIIWLEQEVERLRKENEAYKAEFEANLKAALEMVDLLTKTIKLMVETSNGRN
jgi:hypothetical protein